jgi:hypothetical protein
MFKSTHERRAVQRQVSYPWWVRLALLGPFGVLLLLFLGVLLRFKFTGQWAFDMETVWFSVAGGVFPVGFGLFHRLRLHQRMRMARTGTREQMQQEFSKPVTRFNRFDLGRNVLGIELGCPTVRAWFRDPSQTVLQSLIRKDPSMAVLAAFWRWLEVASMESVSGATVLQPEARDATERLVDIITKRHTSRWVVVSELSRLSASWLARATLVANDHVLLERARAYLEHQPWDLETIAYQAWLEAALGDVEACMGQRVQNTRFGIGTGSPLSAALAVLRNWRTAPHV